MVSLGSAQRMGWIAARFDKAIREKNKTSPHDPNIGSAKIWGLQISKSANERCQSGCLSHVSSSVATENGCQNLKFNQFGGSAMKTNKTVLVVAMLIGLFVMGCACGKKKVVTKPAESPCDRIEIVEASQQFPKSDAIQLTKIAPQEIAINNPFDYRIRVRNITDQELLNVVVTDTKPAHMKIRASDPEVRIVGQKMRWELGTIAPQQTETISVTAMAVQMGTITTCAEVTYDTAICAQIRIVQPRLAVTKTAPFNTLKCDRIPLKYVVTNNGTTHACDIEVRDDFGPGLRTAQGQNFASFAIAALAPGESKEFNAMVDATKTGRYASRAVLTSGNAGEVRSNITTTNVRSPILVVHESCPASQYIGSSVTYTVTVTNNGDGPAKDTVVVASIPEDATFKSASYGGVYTTSSPGMVTWKIGTLQPNSSKSMTMKVLVDQPTTLLTKATARAYCAETASDTCRTTLSGIPAILLEVIDVKDPIEVGQDGTYVITVTNQGSAPDTNIRIVCTIESSMRYLSSGGQTSGRISGNTITFAPLASLAPKAKASWRVNIKAASTGDVRFKTVMSSDQLGRTVQETEATRFYKHK